MNLNQKEFGRLAGIGLQTQSRYETGATQPNAGYFTALAAAGADVLFILTGRRGDSDPLSLDEQQLIDVYRQLAPADREALKRVAERMLAPASLHAPRQGYRHDED